MTILDLPTELHYMIFEGLEKDCDINALACTNHYFHSILNACLYKRKGRSALLWAAKLGRSDTAKLALPSVKAADLGIPLLWASSKGHVHVVRLLLDHNAPVNISQEYSDVLSAASSGGHAEIVKLLLLHGAEINPVSEVLTPLNAAIRHRREEVIGLLLNAGARPQPSTQRLAIFSPVNRQVVRLLMKHGVTFDKDDFGMHRFGLQLPPGEEEAIVKLLRCEWRKRKSGLRKFQTFLLLLILQVSKLHRKLRQINRIGVTFHAFSG